MARHIGGRFCTNARGRVLDFLARLLPRTISPGARIGENLTVNELRLRPKFASFCETFTSLLHIYVVKLFIRENSEAHQDL